MLEQVCECLNVEPGQQWQTKSGDKYWLDYMGNLQIWQNEINSWVCTDVKDYRKFINGEIFPVWQPSFGDTYFRPCRIDNSKKYEVHIWSEDEYDFYLLDNDMVYKTKEEAIEATNKMLESIK